jgi:undecaprenyl-diphosphatase
MHYWQIIILSVVEALTEFLPVSSTAHLILTGQLLGLQSSDFLSSFNIFIQLGAIGAVVVIFWQRLLHNRALWPKIILAFLPTTVLGVLVYKLIKTHLLRGQQITGWALIGGGVFFIIWELFFAPDAIFALAAFRTKGTKRYQKVPKGPNLGPKVLKSPKKSPIALEVAPLQANSPAITAPAAPALTTRQAVQIGLWQVLSFVPGVSRSAATTFGGIFSGLTKAAAIEFAFLLAIPTMLAASGYDLLKTFLAWLKMPQSWSGCTYDSWQQVLPPGTATCMAFWQKPAFIFSPSEWVILGLGLVITFAVSLLLIKFLMKIMTRSRSFLYFGLYRLCIGVIWLLVI